MDITWDQGRILRMCDPDRKEENWILKLVRSTRTWEKEFLTQRCRCGQAPLILTKTLVHDCAACAWATCHHVDGNIFQYSVYGFWFAGEQICGIPHLLHTEDVVRHVTGQIPCPPLSGLTWDLDRIHIDREGVYIRDLRMLSDPTLRPYPCNWRFFPRPSS